MGRSRTKKTRPGIKIIVVLLVFGIFFWLGGTLTRMLNSGVPFDQALLPSRSKDVTILLIGVDARVKNEPSRSDTIILTFFRPELNRIDMLSVPRDSRVDIPGESRQRRINHAHVLGGPPLLEETIEKLLGIKIDRYAEVDFDGFIRAIDVLGGVEINVEKPMLYKEEGIDLSPGLKKLNGEDALGYVRYRNDGLADIGRVQRQQKFLRALGRQVMAPSGLLKTPRLLQEITRNIKTDLTAAEMGQLAKLFTCEPVLNTYMLPGKAKILNGASYWIIDEQKTRILMDEILHPEKKNSGQNPDGR